LFNTPKKLEEHAMKTWNVIVPLFAMTFGTMALLGCNSSDPISAVDANTDGVALIGGLTSADQLAKRGGEITSLTTAEITGLTVMREEEKLARDVYTTLYAKWQTPIFANIAGSEQTHMDAILNLLKKYSLADPAAGKAVGAFADPTLQSLYAALVERGSTSLGDAFTVGATIEDLDIADLEKHIAETNKADIQQVYSNLMKGSRNHMRSFYRNLVAVGMSYVPQYISQVEFDVIVSSSMETGRAQ
jgi:hypothetical protein